MNSPHTRAQYCHPHCPSGLTCGEDWQELQVAAKELAKIKLSLVSDSAQIQRAAKENGAIPAARVVKGGIFLEIDGEMQNDALNTAIHIVPVV